MGDDPHLGMMAGGLAVVRVRHHRWILEAMLHSGAPEQRASSTQLLQLDIDRKPFVAKWEGKIAKAKEERCTANIINCTVTKATKAKQ